MIKNIKNKTKKQSKKLIMRVAIDHTRAETQWNDLMGYGWVWVQFFDLTSRVWVWVRVQYLDPNTIQVWVWVWVRVQVQSDLTRSRPVATPRSKPGSTIRPKARRRTRPLRHSTGQARLGLAL
ncbi:hypothetical protein AMTRI_Chr13g123520 [Amborella trichopoda]